jgi:cell division protein ZapE
MPRTVLQRYDALVASGEIERDPAQAFVVKCFVSLAERLMEHRLARKSSALGWMFGRREVKREPVRGLYVWGGVGRGKTMLMDLFYEASLVQRRRRAHFHAFMADVHERIAEARGRIRRGEVKGDDPIPLVARSIAEESWLLCFDEFHVTDIADAMILGRLFTRLFEEGVVLVATSNVEPSRLYENGLNRALFLPFLELLGQHVDVLKLDSRTDFRLEKLRSRPVWHVPAATAGPALDAAFEALTGGASAQPVTLAVKGRTLVVPHTALGVARMGFADLCAKPLGASDYLALAERFHTLILEGVPVMSTAQRNEARRFITLIDALYDTGVKLVASADAEAPGLWVSEDGYETFAFDRTASRLFEMRSEEYLARPHGRRDSTASGNATGIVET